jgi:hypothetical protein
LFRAGFAEAAKAVLVDQRRAYDDCVISLVGVDHAFHHRAHHALKMKTLFSALGLAPVVGSPGRFETSGPTGLYPELIAPRYHGTAIGAKAATGPILFCGSPLRAEQCLAKTKLQLLQQSEGTFL